MEGQTQIKAEDLLYERLVKEEVNPEFEIFISEFKSKKIYITNYQLEKRGNSENKQSNIEPTIDIIEMQDTSTTPEVPTTSTPSTPTPSTPSTGGTSVGGGGGGY